MILMWNFCRWYEYCICCELWTEHEETETYLRVLLHHYPSTCTPHTEKQDTNLPPGPCVTGGCGVSSTVSLFCTKDFPKYRTRRLCRRTSPWIQYSEKYIRQTKLFQYKEVLKRAMKVQQLHYHPEKHSTTFGLTEININLHCKYD